VRGQRVEAPPLPDLPRDGGGPVFREPWEAQVFAVVLKLYEGGHFAWPEWASRLAAEIDRARREGEPDLGDTYYLHWVRALERLVVDKGWTGAVDLTMRAAALQQPGRDDDRHDHEHDHAV
jgi:nitrile hydratase accessory protein